MCHLQVSLKIRINKESVRISLSVSHFFFFWFLIIAILTFYVFFQLCPGHDYFKKSYNMINIPSFAEVLVVFYYKLAHCQFLLK